LSLSLTLLSVGFLSFLAFSPLSHYNLLGGDDAKLAENKSTWATFLAHPQLNKPEIRSRIAALAPADFARNSPFPVRRAAQRKVLGLPLFPTTTIGSLPQTPEVRNARLHLRKGELTQEAYRAFIGISLTSVFLILSRLIFFFCHSFHFTF
jgi:5-methyltetrahydropteroyltriglutamate--homocysteine methyltransferase